MTAVKYCDGLSERHVTFTVQDRACFSDDGDDRISVIITCGDRVKDNEKGPMLKVILEHDVVVWDNGKPT